MRPYRYIHADYSGSRPVVELALLRSREIWTTPPDGWDEITKDINAERGGDFLYLVYKYAK